MGLTTDYRLGELETAVMQVVWQHDEVSVWDVVFALEPSRVLAYTTVMTILQRLTTKGALTTRKVGKRHYYHAVAQPEGFLALQAQAAVRQVIANFGEAAFIQFMREVRTYSPEQRAAVLRMIHTPNAGTE
jgi:predicted transcriptional regulator